VVAVVVEKNFAKSGLNISAIRRFGLLMALTTLMVGRVGLNHQVNAAPAVANKLPRPSMFDKFYKTTRCLSIQVKGAPSPEQPYDDAVRLNPNDALAYYDRGRFRAFLGYVKEQIDDYDQVIEIDPNHADAYYRRGITRYLAGDKLGGVADLNKSADLLIHRKDVQSQQKGLDIVQQLQQTPEDLNVWMLEHQIWGCIG
jgi:tetratricopeptide (TPR) repeat protein